MNRAATFGAELSSKQKMRCARLLPLALSATALSLCLSAALPLAAVGQMHRVAKSEPVTRAVAVYEFAGTLQKPTAARLIPVSLFIGGHYEDAGSYLARPIPFAIEPDTVYELQHAGEPVGTLDLAYAKNLRGSSAEVTVPFDEAWFGYGRFAALKIPKAPSTGPVRHTQSAYAVQDDGKPHFGSKPGDAKASPRDRRDTSDVDPSADRAEKVSLPDDDRDPKAPNPDRPTLRRRPEDTTGGPKTKKPKETASVTAAGAGPDKDPDRPTIKRKDSASTQDDIPPDPSEVSSTRSTHGAAGTVSPAATGAAASDVLTDTARPELRRNKNATTQNLAKAQAADAPGLAPVAAPGMPTDLQMTVAVSDMQERPLHDFHTPFASDAERASALAEMRALASEVLAKPSLATDAIAFSPATAADPTPPRAQGTKLPSGPGGRPGSTLHRGPRVVMPKNTVLDSTTPQNEQISAFTLSYSAPLTYVYTAQTGASPVRFVTVVAQRNADGKLDIGMRSVTDSAHLDRTPRYRLVDAVDADASNRASLLFEVRNATSRQFALYRLLGPKPDQVFETATVK